jgi:hypothetical protein
VVLILLIVDVDLHEFQVDIYLLEVIRLHDKSQTKERENGEAQTIGIGLRKKQRNNVVDNKDSTIIDPANQREMDDVVNSGIL